MSFTLTWHDNRGGHMRCFDAIDKADDLLFHRLHCDATLKAEDGRIVGRVEEHPGCDDKRVKWLRWRER